MHLKGELYLITRAHLTHWRHLSWYVILYLIQNIK